MRKTTERGSLLQPILLLIGLSIVIFLFILPSRAPGPQRSIFDFSGSSGFSYRDADDRIGSQNSALEPSSQYSRSISLNKGNASSAYQPFQEYIRIENDGRSSISLTGWRLTNGRDMRVHELDGRLIRQPAEEAYIPSGTKILSKNNILQSIVLEPGDEAIVTSGRPPTGGPVTLTSFKENICTGYLETSGDYKFTPSLSKQCVRPSEEPGFQNLPDECQSFIRSMRTCHVPDIGGRDKDGNTCRNCADGKRLPSSCIAFLEAHYTYQGCVAYHGQDKNFYLDTWRVFLGRTWEMWGEKNEVISLFDAAGRLVDYLDY